MVWTAEPEIDAVLGTLLAGSRAVLGADFFGMYLSGSLASGDFDAETSDIDFVVVSNSDTVDLQAEFGALNRQIQASGAPWAARLEGSFLPLRVFEDFNPARERFPTIGMGGRYGLDYKEIERPLQRHVLREHGITLAGPDPRSFIAPVSPDTLKAEARQVLRGWWQSQVDDPVRLKRRGYQAYAVLSMCRALQTLETGEMASKPKAAGWARLRLPSRWHGLIDRACAWKTDDGVDDSAATLKLIRHVIAAADALSPLPAQRHR